MAQNSISRLMFSTYSSFGWSMKNQTQWNRRSKHISDRWKKNQAFHFLSIKMVISLFKIFAFHIFLRMEGIAFTTATKSASRIQWTEIHSIRTNEKDIIAFGYVATRFPCLQLYLLEYTNAFGFCWGWDWSYGNEGHGFIDDYLNCFLNDHDPFQGTKTMA